MAQVLLYSTIELADVSSAHETAMQGKLSDECANAMVPFYCCKVETEISSETHHR